MGLGEHLAHGKHFMDVLVALFWFSASLALSTSTHIFIITITQENESGHSWPWEQLGVMTIATEGHRGLSNNPSST